MNNCDISLGFFSKIDKVVIKIFLLNHCLKVCHFTDIKFEKNPTPISQLFELRTFENFYMTEFHINFYMSFSSSDARSVKTRDVHGSEIFRTGALFLKLWP